MLNVPKGLSHFIWAHDPTLRLLCEDISVSGMRHDDMATNHPSLVTCHKCQDRITALWQRYVEPNWAEAGQQIKTIVAQAQETPGPRTAGWWERRER